MEMSSAFLRGNVYIVPSFDSFRPTQEPKLLVESTYLAMAINALNKNSHQKSYVTGHRAHQQRGLRFSAWNSDPEKCVVKNVRPRTQSLVWITDHVQRAVRSPENHVLSFRGYGQATNGAMFPEVHGVAALEVVRGPESEQPGITPTNEKVARVGDLHEVKLLLHRRRGQ